MHLHVLNAQVTFRCKIWNDAGYDELNSFTLRACGINMALSLSVLCYARGAELHH